MRGINGPIAFHFEIGPVGFIAVAVVLGFFMSLGKAAVYKHIPVYYPHNVGAVGGLVGMIGGLGGFVLPIAFGALNDLTGVWSSCFMLLFAARRRLLPVDAFRRPQDDRARRPPPPSRSPRPPNEPARIEDMTEKLVIVGNGMAPGRMLEHLLEAAPDRYQVTIFNAEPRVNYDRIMLSPVLSGEKDFEEIIIHGDGWYIKQRHHALQGPPASSRSTVQQRP